MSRARLLVLVLVPLASCQHDAACKPGTILLSLSLDGEAAQASSLVVKLGVGTTSLRTAIARHPIGVSHGLLQIDPLPPYPAGQAITVEIDAMADNRRVGVGTLGPTPLPSGCAAFTLAVAATAGDMGPTPPPSDLVAPSSDLACACPYGCSATPSPHCKVLQPSGAVTVGDYSAPGLGTVATTGDVVIDTTSGAITGGLSRGAGSGVINGVGFRLATQVSGPSVAIFAVAGLTVGAGHKVSFIGGNAFALAAGGDVSLLGTVDGSCHGSSGSPGGSPGGSPALGGGSGAGIGGGGGGSATLNGVSGGGGAGFGDSGGVGAPGMDSAMGPGGAIWTPLSSAGALSLLVGGAGGGAGGTTTGGPGGGGGGALQLAVNGNLVISGTVDVSGCGGQTGTTTGAGGGGGGSGGLIFLEAGSITLTSTAILSANGGGGGGGDAGGRGTDGKPGKGNAGGGPGGDNGSDGGNGGASGPQPGMHGTAGSDAAHAHNTKFGGGGGGGTGRIVMRALDLPGGGATVSPDFSDVNANGQKMTVTANADFE
jgi:hypothetical protein